MIDYLNTPVFVTGARRSGASLIARIIRICGGFTGNVDKMMENRALRYISMNYHTTIGADSKGQYPLPESSQITIPAQWQNQITSEIIKQGYDGKRLWLYKGTLICQAWPMWHYAFPSAKWIIVRRRPGDIAESCIKTTWMDAMKQEDIRNQIGVNSEHAGWIWWIREHEKRFVEMIEAGVNCKMIWPERMVQGNYQQIYEMLDWLKLKWTSKIVDEIDPMLWKSRQKHEKIWQE